MLEVTAYNTERAQYYTRPDGSITIGELREVRGILVDVERPRLECVGIRVHRHFHIARIATNAASASTASLELRARLSRAAGGRFRATTGSSGRPSAAELALSATVDLFMPPRGAEQLECRLSPRPRGQSHRDRQHRLRGTTPRFIIIDPASGALTPKAGEAEITAP